MAKRDEPLREGQVVKTPDEEFADDQSPDDSVLLPGSSEALDADQDVQPDVQQEIDEDRAMFSDNPLIIDAVFEWLNNEITDCDSIEAAKNLAKNEQVSLDVAIETLNLCRKVFTAKKVSFQNIRDSISKE